MSRFVMLTCALLCCTGCSAVSLGPDRIHTVDDQVTTLRMFPSEPPKNAQQLADFVTERMFEIDLEYSVYFAKLTSDSQLGNLAGDMALLGLTAASTVVPASSTKTILSATATAVTGAKTAIDKDVLLSHTIQLLQSQMETSRTLIRNRILGNLNSKTNPYTYWSALSDLEEYYRAGTIPGALESLAAAAGSNAQNAKNCTNGANQASQQVICTTSSGGTPPPPAPPGQRPQTSRGMGVTSRGGLVPALR